MTAFALLGLSLLRVSVQAAANSVSSIRDCSTRSATTPIHNMGREAACAGVYAYLRLAPGPVRDEADGGVPGALE